MDPPPIQRSLGTRENFSNPMIIGLRIDYVTWSNFHKWIPPTLNLHLGPGIKFPILWV